MNNLTDPLRDKLLQEKEELKNRIVLSYSPRKIDRAVEIPFYTDPIQSIHSAASTLGKLGGQVSSPSKSISSRLNGKKGGRPKKNIIAIDTSLFE
jgi:hypothetical protein